MAGRPPDRVKRVDSSKVRGRMLNAENQTDRVPWLRWIDRLSILLAILGGVATLGLMTNVVIDVLGRYFFNRPLPGTLDLTQFAWMPTLVSLGLGYALLRGEHIRVNLLTAPTRPRTQRIIEIVGMVFTFVTAALFIWFCVRKANEAMDFGEKAVGAHWLAIWPFRWVIVVGMIGLMLQAFAQMLRAITVAEFKSSDADEAAAALEVEETVFDELEHELADPGSVPATTKRVEIK
jgi:TRAP-type mannitol/chloroaromatic compound transport system permease small subunit